MRLKQFDKGAVIRAVPSIALNTHKHYIKTLLIVCLSCIKIILIHRRIFLNEIIKS